jgi:hypothetical protein
MRRHESEDVPARAIRLGPDHNDVAPSTLPSIASGRSCDAESPVEARIEDAHPARASKEATVVVAPHKRDEPGELRAGVYSAHRPATILGW